MTDVTSFDDLTPEQIDAHMTDETWGNHLEGMVDRLLENSSEQDKQDAYALISMFVQTSYMGSMFNNLQTDAVNLFQLGDSLYKDLVANNIESESTQKWIGAVEAIDKQASDAQELIRSIGDQ